MSGDAASDKSSLFGVVSFRPKLTVVLVILTLTVAVVGYRIFREPGSGKMEGMTRESLRIFEAGKNDRTKLPPLDPANVEEKVREWTGIKTTLPRDERFFYYSGAGREKIGKLKAGAVHFSFADEPCLLLIMRPEQRSGAFRPEFFPESSFLSWEKDGNSFVMWERDGIMFLLVSGVDLTRTFDLVRQFFS